MNCQAKRLFPEVDFGVNKILVCTGTVVIDYAERWPSGNHMRSSIIVNYDEVSGTIETLNSYYQLIGPKGDTVIGGGDWGRLVMSIFY